MRVDRQTEIQADRQKQAEMQTDRNKQKHRQTIMQTKPGVSHRQTNLLKVKQEPIGQCKEIHKVDLYVNRKATEHCIFREEF